MDLLGKTARKIQRDRKRWTQIEPLWRLVTEGAERKKMALE